MGKDGGQWEVEDEEGGQNQRGKQGEIRWQVVEEKMEGRWRRGNTGRWTWMTGGTRDTKGTEEDKDWNAVEEDEEMGNG